MIWFSSNLVIAGHNTTPKGNVSLWELNLFIYEVSLKLGSFRKTIFYKCYVFSTKLFFNKILI